MNGRLRRAWIREANRAGRRDCVKFAEANNASLDRGGRPCLDNEKFELMSRMKDSVQYLKPYLRRSAKVSRRRGLEASKATSSFAASEPDLWSDQ